MFAKVLVLVSLANTGEANQAKALLSALADKTNIETIRNIDVNSNNFKEEYAELSGILKSEGPYLTLVIGEVAINRAPQLDIENTYILLGSHQYVNKIKELPFDHLTLPEAAKVTAEHALSELMRRRNDALYTFTPNTLNITLPDSELQELYYNWNDDKKPALNGKYIIVTLPGDAPNPLMLDENGNPKQIPFTISSATKLFKYVQNLHHELGGEHDIIVQNSPRTGKYNEDGTRIVCTHKYNKGETPMLDRVSKHFIDLLQGAGLSYRFYNFAIEVEDMGNGKAKETTISHYNQLIYIAKQSAENRFILPGESSSMYTDIPYYLKPEQIIVYKPNSMNKTHTVSFDLAFKKGYLTYFDEEGRVQPPATLNKKVKNDDAELVAANVIQDFEHHIKDKKKEANVVGL
jgi:hypothetical protein